jgi:hypothetical protein
MNTTNAPGLVRKADRELSRLLVGAIKDATVNVHDQYFYLVDFGPDVQPRHHVVGKDGLCTCPLEGECPALEAVKKYIKNGGQRAETPRPGFYPAAPKYCPVCKADGNGPVQARYFPGLSSKHRGAGWICAIHGVSHYWLDQARCSARTAVKKGPFPETSCTYPFKDGYDPNREYPSGFCNCRAQTAEERLT